MDFNEKLNATGHLEVIKIDKETGEETVLFDDHNVITSGLGQSIAQFMTVSGCSEELCVTEHDRFGARPSVVPKGTANANYEDGQGSEGFSAGSDSAGGSGISTRMLACCIGLLDITAVVTFTPGATKTSINFEATVQVDTLTECDIYTPCEGSDPIMGPYGKSCLEKVEQRNSDINFANGVVGEGSDGFNGGTMRFKYQEFTKLGCCMPGCPLKSNSTTSTFTGTLPGGWVETRTPGQPTTYAARYQKQIEQDFGDQLRAGFSFGGSEGEPDFPECCDTPPEEGGPQAV